MPEDFLKEARLLPESCTNTEVSESYQDRLVEHENITKGEWIAIKKTWGNILAQHFSTMVTRLGCLLKIQMPRPDSWLILEISNGESLAMVFLKSSLGDSNVQLVLRITNKAVLVYLCWEQVGNKIEWALWSHKDGRILMFDLMA